jgi:hypothetical protein
MVPLAILSAGVALETDPDELPLAVLPAVEFVEMPPRPAIRAIAVGSGQRHDPVSHGRIIHLVVYIVNNQNIDTAQGGFTLSV